MKIRLLFKLIAIILVFIILGYNVEIQRAPSENLSIPSTAGFDIEKSGTTDIYKISLNSYIFQEGGAGTEIGTTTLSTVTTGIGFSIGQARQDRQLKIDKRFILGLEKVDIISEEQARTGIKNILDILFSNESVNDTALVAICKDKAKDILELKVTGYPSSGDYIEEMIKNSQIYNFFGDYYKIIDTFVRVDSEGRKVILPYIEKSEESLKITGLSLFKADKMVAKIDIKDSKDLNMLIGGSGKGIITLQKNSDSYTDYYAKIKRKVKCKKYMGKYIFQITLNFNGEIITNQYNKKIQNDVKEKEKLEKELSESIEKKCKDIIYKMQNVYKLDCLGLGRIAAAKYGRDTGIDWDEVVSNSEINVKANVKISKQGRGTY